MALETGLALHHWDQVANRDAVKTYNAFTLDQAEALAPEFPWRTWFSAMEAPEGSIEKVVVRQPSFVTGLGRALTEVPLEDWQAWLTFHVVSTFAGLLPEALVDEDFDFYGRTLSGQPHQGAVEARGRRGRERGRGGGRPALHRAVVPA